MCGDVVQFRILGPLSVDAGTHSVALGPPKQRLLLAVLVCHLGEPAHPATLIDALWGSAPPASAAHNLRSYVHGLRGALGANRLESRGRSGYRLLVEPSGVDAHQFGKLTAAGSHALAAGDPVHARITLGDAFALWRGRPFAGMEGEPALREETARLEEWRWRALEDRIDADLALGRHNDLVAELLVLTGAHPYRERFHYQLMLALYRSGRQAEALKAHRNIRHILAHELGVEPGPALRELQQRMLHADPTLHPRAVGHAGVGGHGASVPRQLPPRIASFTGRSAELAHICHRLRQPNQAGAPAIAVLTGLGGIGKTALALQVSHELHQDYPDGQLFAALGAADGGRIDPTVILCRFLFSLGVSKHAIPAATDERVDLFRSLVANRRLLILLDDAADEDQVRPLIPSASRCAVLITSRARLVGLECAAHVVLSVLDTASSIDLLRRTVGGERMAADPRAARELAQLCGGLPLALRVAASRLLARPHWTPAVLAEQLRDEHRRLDQLTHGNEDVHKRLSASYQGLDSDTQRMLRLVSLLDTTDFPAWAGAALADIPVERAEELIERLVDVHLVEVARQGPIYTRYRLHELTRIYGRDLAETHDSSTARIDALTRAFQAWFAITTAAQSRINGGDTRRLSARTPGWPIPAAIFESLSADPLVWVETERPAIHAITRHATRLGLGELLADGRDHLADLAVATPLR